MSESVRVATSADATHVVAVLADGFTDDPVMRWVFGDSVASALPPFFDFIVREALIPLGATYTNGDCCAVWTPPNMDPWSTEELAGRFLRTMSAALSRDQLDRLVVLNELTERMHPREQHWYLGMIASRRSAQRAGAGSALLRHTLAAVDRDRLPAYLESTNRMNVPFYERHGFAACGLAEIAGGPTLTRMWRDPKGSRDA